MLNPAKDVIEFSEGVRLLQVQAHNYSGDIYLCYTDCVSTRNICDAALPEPGTRNYTTEELSSATFRRVRNHPWFPIDPQSKNMRS
jgi:hypothetical protein